VNLMFNIDTKQLIYLYQTRQLASIERLFGKAIMSQGMNNVNYEIQNFSPCNNFR